MHKTGTNIGSTERTRRSRTLDGRVVRRPFRVHFLQFLKGFDSLLDGAGECGTVLVVEELVDMAGNCLALVVGWGWRLGMG